MNWEDDREIPEYRYVYTPMPKASGANVAIFIFGVIAIALFAVALYGYMTGAWDQQPPW